MLTSMARFSSTNFYQNRPKIRLFLLQKYNFRALAAPPLNPRNIPSPPPELQNSGYALGCSTCSLVDE